MTSLAGAVQAVDSGELLESIRLRGIEEPALASLLKPVVAHPPAKSVPKRGARPSARTVPLSVAIPDVSGLYVLAKRVTDIIGSIVGLIVLSPVLTVISL